MAQNGDLRPLQYSCFLILITNKILLKAYNGNRDGFGLMYSKNNKSITEKFLPKKFKSVLKCFNKHAKNTNQIALHFRFATQGEKNNFNSHPFCILNKKLGDNFDLFLNHIDLRITRVLSIELRDLLFV